MKYVPSSTLAATIDQLRQWIIGELQRLSIILRNEDTAFDTKIEVVEANATAALTAESTARASADSALASSLTTISSTVAGHTSSITTLQATSTSLSGDVANLNAQYSVTVSAGKVTGFKLNSSPTTSEFIVQADKFKIENATGAPFQVIGGTVFIKNAVIQNYGVSTDKLATDAVITEKIQANAVSTSTYAQSSGTVSSTGTAQTLQTLTVITEGGPMLVQFSVAGYAQASGAGAYGYAIKLYRDSTLLRSSLVFQGTAYAAGDRLPFMFHCPVMDVPAAGTYTYSFTIEPSGGATAGVNASVHRAIDVRELKR